MFLLKKKKVNLSLQQVVEAFRGEKLSIPNCLDNRYVALHYHVTSRVITVRKFPGLSDEKKS
jgi:hypothetical protein